MEMTRTTLAELAAAGPAAARVLQRHRLDFCCGGRRSLEEACAERGIDPQVLLAEIESRPAEMDVRPESLAPVALVDFIIARFHEPLREELTRLVQMAGKVERVHRDKPSCPVGLALHVADMRDGLCEHMAKEEQILFPMIRAGFGPRAHMPITMMMAEHEDHAENLRRTRALTADLVAPSDACGTWRALYDGLRELELDLMRHVHLENNVLFPAVLNG
ncbi:MAG: iron-sulfur cluster repair di-iron protein [Deltaproteobacteria bacterium]|nr:iron-sulfur cluster repair di-iron protein [Deltaproteobacteria bacterium]